MADEPKKEQLEEGQQQAKVKKDQGRMVFFVVLGLVFALNAVVAFFLIQITRPKDPEAEMAALEAADTTGGEERGPSVKELAVSEPIEAIVNVKGEEGMRFLKAVIVLAYDAKRHKMLGEMLAERLPEFQNLVIDELSSRSLEDLQRENSREEIRKRIKRMVNDKLPKDKPFLFLFKKKVGTISDVLIKEFIIQ